MKHNGFGSPPPPLSSKTAASKQEVGSATKAGRGRFKSGHSGNPRGRPPGVRNRKTVVHEIAAEMHWVVESGERRRRSTLELILLTIRNLALEGDAKKFRAFERCLERYGEKEPQRRGGYLVVPEPCRTLEEFEESLAGYQEYLRQLLAKNDEI